MLITKEWSDPQPIEYGKSIRLRFSKDRFSVMIYNAKGQGIEKSINSPHKIFEILAGEISGINPQMIKFKTDVTDTHIEFEQF